MITRIIIFSCVALFTGFVAIAGLAHDRELWVVPSLFFVASVFAIGWVVWNAIRFKIVGHVLVIYRPLRGAESLEIDTMDAWSELSYNIRGQTRRTLVLMFANERRLFIDNHDYPTEYDELQFVLYRKYLDRKQFSVASSAG